jgi:hypothetical protein
MLFAPRRSCPNKSATSRRSRNKISRYRERSHLADEIIVGHRDKAHARDDAPASPGDARAFA